MNPPNNKLYWIGGWLYDFTKITTFFVFIILFIHYFLYTIFIVSGPSMTPALVDGDIMLVNRLEYRLAPVERDDIIALYFPGEDQKKFVKRVIGLPGEKITIKNSQVFINDKLLAEPYIGDALTAPDQEVSLSSDEYFVMGDNRIVSSDSRVWGPLPKEYVIGLVGRKLSNKTKW